MNTPELDALILRACQPQPGDRFLRSELYDVIIEDVTPHPEFEAEVTCKWTIDGVPKTETIFVGYYRLLAKRTLEGGYIFIPAGEEKE